MIVAYAWLQINKKKKNEKLWYGSLPIWRKLGSMKNIQKFSFLINVYWLFKTAVQVKKKTNKVGTNCTQTFDLKTENKIQVLSHLPIMKKKVKETKQ